MVLNDKGIAARANLIVPLDPNGIRNCAYSLRAGKAFESKTGDEIVLRCGKRQGQHAWVIKPAETMIVMTLERVTVPRDLCAAYAPLHHKAQEGLMLLNAAIVEPGYSGPLSCFLLNVSSQDVVIEPESHIAKIVFHQLEAAPETPKAMQLTDKEYIESLSKQARKFPKSFLDVGNIAEEASEQAIKGVRSRIILAGVFLAVLIMFAQVEPIVSRYFSATLRSALERETALHAEIEKLQRDKDVVDLRERLAELKERVSELSSHLPTSTAPSPPAAAAKP